MLFTSSTFLFAFMPAFFLIYFLLPGRGVRNAWLLVASLVFYAWGEPVYVGLRPVKIVDKEISDFLRLPTAPPARTPWPPRSTRRTRP